MRQRWMVLVAPNEVALFHKGRVFGNFEALTDAEKLAGRVNERLASGWTATAIPFYQGVTSGKAVCEQLPPFMLAGK